MSYLQSDIEAVILYTTNDNRFFNTCINNLLNCGIKCNVVTYTHMWDGTEENQNILNQNKNTFLNNPNVIFHSIDWHPGENPWFWEIKGRDLAIQKSTRDYCLLIDIDEIIDPITFPEWISTKEYTLYDVIKLRSYWYWREPIYRSTLVEYSAVIVKTSLAKQTDLREGYGRAPYIAQQRTIGHSDKNLPLIHHFSWVRTKEEMINKVKNWAHKDDQNWLELVENEFSSPFTNKDFIYGYELEVVDNILKI